MTLCLHRGHKVIKVTYDRDQDTFRYHFLVIPCAVLAILINNERTPLEVGHLTAVEWTCTDMLLRPLQILWTFSIYLEAVAILPQLVLLQRTQNIDNLTGNYVFLLG